jgi:hypothetical protein
MTNIKDLLSKKKNEIKQINSSTSFDDDSGFENKKGLKINNAKSNIPKPPERIDVISNAQKILADIEFQNKMGWNLTSRLLSVFKNKKLQQNKSEEEKQAENQVLLDYLEFAKLINNDQNQEEGMGSVVFSLAIVKCALLQRDQINEQGKMIDILERKVKMLEYQFSKITSQNK